MYIVQWEWNYRIVIKLCYIYIRPIQLNYLSYELPRQEMSHFGIEEKLKNVVFFGVFSLPTRTGSKMFITAYSQLNEISQSINPCSLKGGRYTSSKLRLYYSTDNFLKLIEFPLQWILLKLAVFGDFFSLTENI